MSTSTTTRTADATNTQEGNDSPHVVAIAQFCSTADKVANLLQMAQCAEMARREQAKMIFFPEACGFLGDSALQTVEHAEEANSYENCPENPEWLTKLLEETIQNKSCHVREEQNLTQPISILDGLRTIAKASGMWVSAGGVHILAKEKEDNRPQRRVYNTHLILDKNGDIKASYRKIHLFDVDIPGRVTLRESNSTAPGDELVVVDSPIGRLGVTVCYDVRFPEMYVDLTQKYGAQILLVPSAFTVPTGQAHWHVLLRARAIESQCYVLAAAQYGQHNAKRSSYGHSLAVDPFGVVVADAGGVDSVEPPDQTIPKIVTATIDLSKLETIRQRMPIQQHRQAAQTV